MPIENHLPERAPASSAFLPAGAQPELTVATGIRRQMLSHGPQLMLCRVSFDSGAVGDLHTHPHAQVTYVESGRFRFHVDGRECELAAGGSCHVSPGLVHGTTCIEAGVLIDAFTPMREDFLPQAEGA